MIPFALVIFLAAAYLTLRLIRDHGPDDPPLR